VKITFKCHIESRTESWTEEYTLDDSETAEWCTLDAAAQEKWKNEWAESVFLNSCSYGTDVVVENE